MADKQTQALKRLAKKLSALRKTLRKDERQLLDALILEEAAEVRAHQAAEAVAAVVAMDLALVLDEAASNYVIAEQEAEVKGHMVSAAVDYKVDEAISPANRP